MSQEQTELKHISLSDLRENKVALRTVARDTESYKEMVESVKTWGVRNPINVRVKTDPETGNPYYELMDGLHRFSAAKDAGLDTIPCQVFANQSENEVLEAQIIANTHKVETKPIEYTNQLKRILNMNPLITTAELARRLNKSTTWIEQRLSLTKITNEKIKELIDNGKIKLANAYVLAKMPEEEQIDFLEDAQTEAPDIFIPKANSRMKEIRESRRKGEAPQEPTFIPQPHLRKMNDIREILESEDSIKDIVATCKTPFDAAVMMVKWVINLDENSVDEQRARWEERQNAKKEREAARKAKEAQKRADKKKAELEAAQKEAAEAASV
jgi:ParB/RepB/Spo0J family partition protein